MHASDQTIEKEQTIERVAESIESREDFEHFLRALMDDLRDNAGAWENTDLPRFLSGLYGYAQDAPAAFSDPPAWNELANLMLAARVYE